MPRLSNWQKLWEGSQLVLEGNIEKGEPMIRQCYKYLLDGNERQCVGISFIPLAEVLFQRGRTEEILEKTNFFLTNPATCWRDTSYALMYGNLGTIAALQKKYEEAD